MSESALVIIEPGARSKTYLKDLWHYRDLIWLFIKRDFTAAYKQTLLGPLWHFIKPILTTIVSFVLFNVVAKIPTNGMNPILFQMSGIIIWNYFVACFTNTSNTFVANAGIFGKVYFPRLVSPISTVISQIIQFGIQFLLLLATMVFFSIGGAKFPLTNSWFLIPVILIILAGMGLGFGIIISSVTTKYRDLTVLIGFGIQLLMYASAVNYPLSSLEGLGEEYSWLYFFVKWNPLASMVELFRNSVLGTAIQTENIIYPFAWTIILLTIGIRLFSRVERTFMDTV